MGAGTPKSEYEERIAALEEIVKDAIIEETSDDPVLLKLIEITIVSITENSGLFSGSPLDEPAFYRRRFRRWVQEGLEEARKMNEVNLKTG